MAITQTYVDYGAGNDATGDGTIGTPWKTLQHAFDTLTRNTTDGNQVNLKAGTAHVNAAALDLATFIAGGALTPAAPLIVRGYTSAANDGGKGEIDCNDATMWASANYDYVRLIDLYGHNGGNSNLVDLRNNITALRCEFTKGASNPSVKTLLRVGLNCFISHCYVHDAGTTGYGIYVGGSSGRVSYNYVANCPGFEIASASPVIGNIVLRNSATGNGLTILTTDVVVEGNIVYNLAAGVGPGIYLGAIVGRYAQICANNIVAGFSGAGGIAIGSGTAGTYQYLVGYNAFYNNTTNYSVGDVTFIDETAHDVALAADPFTDAANGDFSLTAAAKTALRGVGWPTSYLGAHANTVPNLNIGPIQLAASAGGGGRPAFGDRTGGKF